MKKILALGALALIAAGCNQNNTGYQNNNNNSGQSQAPANQVYANQTYGFQFAYPENFEFVTPTYPNLQDKIVQLQTKANAYPNTNFNDAAFSASAQFAKTLQDCLALSLPESANKGFNTKTSINGVDFYMNKGAGAAAGNIYDQTVYRTLKGQNCIELSETIHTGNIGNYPPGQVTEVDKGQIQNQLDSILQSFKFTN